MAFCLIPVLLYDFFWGFVAPRTGMRCSDYGFLISDCVCLRGKGNYSIQFVKRQANKCAHVLTKHACFNVSLYESFVIPSWLEEVFISDLLST